MHLDLYRLLPFLTWFRLVNRETIRAERIGGRAAYVGIFVVQQLEQPVQRTRRPSRTLSCSRSVTT
jgi:hypothetical protein